MLVNTQLSGFGGGGPDSKFLYDILVELGLTAQLFFCLDAADTRSYDGSSQTWTDATGTSRDFFLGLDGSAGSNDPTFNGTAGVADEGTYFSSDGGDFFREASAHTFADDWHQDNGQFALMFVCYVPSSTQFNLWSSSGASFDSGIDLLLTSARKPQLVHSTNIFSGFETLTSTLTATNASWNFIAASFSEGAASMDFVCNGSTENFAVGASTDTANAAAPLTIGARGDLSVVMPSGARIACCAGGANISVTDLSNVYTRLKARRFTSLP